MKLLGFTTLCFIWGLTFLGIKLSLRGFTPLVGAGIRVCIATFLVVAIIGVRRDRYRVSRRELQYLLACALLVFGLNYWLVYWSTQHLEAGIAAIFFATYSLSAVFWSSFMFRHEPFAWRGLLGILIGIGGVLLVFYDQVTATRFNLATVLACAGIVIGANGAALASVITKVRLARLSPLTLTFYQSALGAGLLLSLATCFERPFAIRLDPVAIAAILALATVGSTLAFVLYFKLLKVMSPITLGLLTFFTPVVAVLADYLFMGTLASPRAIVGMLVIFGGVRLTRLATSAGPEVGR
ncbi:MAG: DMT family transporter [bacterium]